MDQCQSRREEWFIGLLIIIDEVELYSLVIIVIDVDVLNL